MEVVQYIKHIASAGETPDILALKYYNDEYLSSYIIEANVKYNDIIIYEGGEELYIPVFDTLENDETLAPWRRS